MDHKQLLLERQPDLIDQVDIKYTTLWDHLLSKRAVTQHAMDQIRAECRSNGEQVREYLGYLRRRPRTDFLAFKEALKATNQAHVVEELLCEPNQRQVEVLYDYNATDGDELSIRKGDIINIHDDSDSDWWRGELNGECGLFPQNFVKLLPPQKQKTKKPVPPPTSKPKVEPPAATRRETPQPAKKKDVGSAKGMHRSHSWEIDLGKGSYKVTGVQCIVGLLDKGALVGTDTHPSGLSRVDATGAKKGLDFCCGGNITSAILQGDIVFILENHGRITKCRLNDLSKSINKWEVKQVGSLQDGIASSDEQLTLIDYTKGEAFVWNLEKNSKQVKVTGLSWPSHINSAGSGDSTMYAITETGNPQVQIFDATWQLKYRIGGEAHDDWKLMEPRCTILLSSGNILLADRDNHEVAEYNKSGSLVCKWLTQEDGITYPFYISYVVPHLWVVCYNYEDCNRRAMRFKI